MNSLFDILSLKVNSDYLWAKGPSKRKSCRVGINCVDFRCALEESPFNTADTDRSQAPDTDDVAFLDTGINDGVIRSRKNIRKIYSNFCKHSPT